MNCGILFMPDCRERSKTLSRKSRYESAKHAKKKGQSKVRSAQQAGTNRGSLYLSKHSPAQRLPNKPLPDFALLDDRLNAVGLLGTRFQKPPTVPSSVYQQIAL